MCCLYWLFILVVMETKLNIKAVGVIFINRRSHGSMNVLRKCCFYESFVQNWRDSLWDMDFCGNRQEKSGEKNP